MKIEISKAVKRYLVWAGFELKNREVEYKKRLICEGICDALYSFTSILLICLNEADYIVMWLNLICLLRVIIHNSIYGTVTTKELEYLNRKQKIFTYYHLKMAVVIAATIAFAIITAGVVISSRDCGQEIKIISIFVILVILFDNCEELAVFGYGASMVAR